MEGYKIGPLFAENSAYAAMLFDSLTMTGAVNPFSLMSPNRTMQQDARRKIPFEPVFNTVRMYTKKTPNLPLNKIFGITTYELG